MKTSIVEAHPERAAIERDLAAATKLRVIAERYCVNVKTLSAHRKRLERTNPIYFAAMSPTPISVDSARLLAALGEIACAIDRAARILSA